MKFCENALARLSTGMVESLPSEGFPRDLPELDDEFGAFDCGMAESDPGV